AGHGPDYRSGQITAPRLTTKRDLVCAARSPDGSGAGQAETLFSCRGRAAVRRTVLDLDSVRQLCPGYSGRVSRCSIILATPSSSQAGATTLASTNSAGFPDSTA